jgi:hypothetical protein
MPFGGNHHRIHLSGKPQRLVLKVVRLTDACACSIPSWVAAAPIAGAAYPSCWMN